VFVILGDRDAKRNRRCQYIRGKAIDIDELKPVEALRMPGDSSTKSMR